MTYVPNSKSPSSRMLGMLEANKVFIFLMSIFPEAMEIYMLKALLLVPERILIRSDPIYICDLSN